ncbi:MAG: hypothetical protein COB02_18260 [Candidatus Cloacimonadota bacterium]|nr:MAG: hypothetical protein COB02_18260 [Candidatus Cloacimonadota bacterium]
MSSGYILISRSTIESEIWTKPALYIKVWLYLIIKAQHKDFRNLKRGQLRTSIREVQDACSHDVGFRREVPSYKKIRSIFDWLRKTHEGVSEGQHERTIKGTMIGTTKGTQGILVTIDKYSTYQDPSYYEGQHEGHNESLMKVNMNGQRRAREGQDINKNEKNDKNEEEKNNIKKENQPPTPQGEIQLVSSSKIIPINENKKFKPESDVSKSVIDKKKQEIIKKFGANRFLNAYTLFDLFLAIGKTKSFHKEIQSIKNICNILKKDLASLDDLKKSIENYKISKSEQIEEGYIFSCANFFGSKDEYTNYTSLVVEVDPMDAFYKEMEDEINNG